MHNEYTMNSNFDKLETYKLWAENIFSLIKNSFSYYGYIQGLKDFFAEKRKLTFACKNFIDQLVYLLQSTICLNISKLLFDKGNDVYSLALYKKVVEEYKGERTMVKRPKIDADLENKISDFRKTYIAHSIDKYANIKITLSELFDLLKKANEYFNALTDNSIIEKGRRFDNDSIPLWINHYKTGVWDFLVLSKK